MANFLDYDLDPCRQQLASRLHAAATTLAAGAPLALSVKEIGLLLEKPPESKLGDYALPCFRFAKDLKKKPQDIAQELAKILVASGSSLNDGGHEARDAHDLHNIHEQAAEPDWIERVEVASAFLNIFVSKSLMADTVIPGMLSGTWFRRLAANRAHLQQRVMIEYSQPNTHKEFHVGHARNVCLGNALVRLFRYCGYQVLGANYYGDEGTHIAIALWYIQRTQAQAPSTDVEARGEWLGLMYATAKQFLAAASDLDRKEYESQISEILRAIEAKSGPTYELWLETRRWSLEAFSEIYKWLDVSFDVEFFESEVSAAAQNIVTEYLAKGVLIEDQGAIGVDLKPYKLGFCILRKRDGNTLYATKDLALARRKFEDYQIDRSIYVVADEQSHHFRQVFKVLELMGFEQAKQCFHLSYGLVMLPEGKMSSRDGTSVAFTGLRSQMLVELGAILKKYESDWTEDEINQTAHRLCDGAIKYGMISTDPVGKIIFNLEDWLSFEGNSGPYLMYSYTRTQSILRKAAEQGVVQASTQVGLNLSENAEYELLRYLYDFNEVVAGAAENYKPSILASHLFFMCKAFNRFYAEVPVLKAESATARSARLALISAFSTALKEGLNLLGIRPPERM